MRKPIIFFLYFLSLFGCGNAATTSNVPPVVIAPVAPHSKTSIKEQKLQQLGSINNTVVYEKDLDPQIIAKLSELHNESEQRRLHLLWLGFEDAISKKLLAQEAQRRKISVEALREQEIFANIEKPSDEEIQEFYDQNADQIGIDFETAGSQIRAELTAQRAREAERAFIDQLRESVEIKYNLPINELPRIKFNAGEGPSWGSRNAKVVIVEFSDFQCPYCARASVILKKLSELYPNDLRIEFRNFPLKQHHAAYEAAKAALCANEQGKFWQYHDLLFANSRALGADDLQRYANEVAIDTDKFSKCLASDRPGHLLEKMAALGQQIDIQGTPAIYLNGIQLIGLLPLPIMQALIDNEISNL
ncbi:MAG: thioredoxin domain-containing protein [Deltaproteobacteria bacterium]|nr:thioredoxin domain-containing protein [Deltaproteobacteria bacterium]